MLTTTLNEILENKPRGSHCYEDNGFNLLLKNLGKTQPDDAPVTIMQILESNGIEDAIWALRCFDYKDYCLFLADVAESVLHIFEERYDDKAPRLLVDGIRRYHSGDISRDELYELKSNVCIDVSYPAYPALFTAFYATTTCTANTYDCYVAATRYNKQEELETLFIKHFGE